MIVHFDSGLLRLWIVVFSFGVFVVALKWARTQRAQALALPPGPIGHWLYGLRPNPAGLWRQFAEWTEIYGPVFSYRHGSQVVVVVGRYQAAVEIMEKHGAVLSDRPRTVAAGEVLSGGMRPLLTRAGDRLRKIRRALHTHMQYGTSAAYSPIQFENAKNLVLDIMQRPDDHINHARRYAASVVMTITYGKTTPTSYSDPEVQRVIRCLSRIGQAVTPGRYLVDSYPALRYVPGYLRQLKAWHREEMELFWGQAQNVRQKMTRGEGQPCFVTYLMENQRNYQLSDNELAYLAGGMFGAGSDTTAAAISFVIMAAALHPDAQACVQSEIDSVVGPDRIPDFSDEDSLPRLRAFIMEVLRWRPVSIGGFAHRATEDIIWNRYRIPAGATVIGNHWSIAHDPDMFKNPDTFDPQRWFTNGEPSLSDARIFTFGFGRRVCPGQHIANRSVFITAAMLLWSFTISEDPCRPIDSMAMTDSANVHPLPFFAKFHPRRDNLREFVQTPT
ncbi:cytochrome P450 [Punctularia strigosozonata HHB-11173 SS5]|uniref:cytochrome P450 n=1 Tax=Punctularia strigosozonata (strain HHB-11173) TaxID=741275 RepID=UPI000441785B|nr:cytochrome P450 [Punctularia strigosozonata HHB-11173 SS5]EIN08589.1 cytochrome P450 [Punctularia strigosozonata HHB-11173 SS5]